MFKLTIVVPFIDSQKVEMALESIGKIPTNVQVLLIDDGSDNLDKVNPRLYTNSLNLPYNTLQNLGVSTPGGIPRALGTIYGRGEWVTYLDQDNWYYPNYLNEILQSVNKVDDNCLYLHCYRTMHEPSATFKTPKPFCHDYFESIGKTMLDTNCMIINRKKFLNYAGAWAFPIAYGDDRIVFNTLQQLKQTKNYTSSVIDTLGINYVLRKEYYSNLVPLLKSGKLDSISIKSVVI